MKNKLLFFNYIILLVVWLAILFQSLHAIEHLTKQFTTKHCNHKYNRQSAQINHVHDNLDICYTCQYSFSNYLPINLECFTFFKNILKNQKAAGVFKKFSAFWTPYIPTRGPPFFRL